MTNMTKEHPILFKDAMVRAILNGTKTQTRRIVKPQPSGHYWESVPGYELKSSVPTIRTDEKLHVRFWHSIPQNPHQDEAGDASCPYGKPGERLWVREAWAAPHAFDHLPPRLIPSDANFHYAADGSLGGLLGRPSIHMPRWASRIALEITDVRVERLQDISHADAMSEGVIEVAGYLDGLEACSEHRNAFEDLWCAINGPDSWAANPWVWVIEFKRV